MALALHDAEEGLGIGAAAFAEFVPGFLNLMRLHEPHTAGGVGKGQRFGSVHGSHKSCNSWPMPPRGGDRFPLYLSLCTCQADMVGPRQLVNLVKPELWVVRIVPAKVVMDWRGMTPRLR